MAQKLKEETRAAILSAAKEEFEEKGYEDASMRSIANKAGITVGNIYRYFDNKEDLHKHILSDTSEDLTKILRKVNVDRLPIQPRVFGVKTDMEELKGMIEDVSSSLNDLYLKKESEFLILLNDPEQSQPLKHWLDDTISKLLNQSYLMNDRYRENEVLSHAYREACFEGIKDLFAHLQEGDDGKRLLYDYLYHFMKMIYELESGN